jgi:mono/diheme cytochrome c family protein
MEVAMWKEAKIISSLAFFLFAGSVQEKKKAEQELLPAESKIPPEEAQRQNPVKPTPSSIAESKKRYGFECEMCHGPDGNGKGDLVQSMELKVRDYRDSVALKDMKDGELYYIIAKGKGKMPGEEDRMKPEQIWKMINYVRSLAHKELPPKSKVEKPQPNSP